MTAMIDKISIQLSRSQIDNLINFIELEFIDSIRRDEEIDNIDYIINMMETLKTLRAASDTTVRH